MAIQTLGALPPYTHLLGGKRFALIAAWGTEMDRDAPAASRNSGRTSTATTASPAAMMSARGYGGVQGSQQGEVPLPLSAPPQANPWRGKPGERADLIPADGLPGNEIARKALQQRIRLTPQTKPDVENVEHPAQGPRLLEQVGVHGDAQPCDGLPRRRDAPGDIGLQAAFVGDEQLVPHVSQPTHQVSVLMHGIVRPHAGSGIDRMADGEGMTRRQVVQCGRDIPYAPPAQGVTADRTPATCNAPMLQEVSLAAGQAHFLEPWQG